MVGVASNYPGGFKHGVAIRGTPILNTHGGNVFWVDSGSGADAANDGTFNKPFATLDYAVGRCTANNGDIILLKPGHAENITTHDNIDFDVAGIEVIGLGQGNDRATFTWSGTDATACMTVGADNVALRNLVFVCNDTGNDVASALQIGADTTGIDDVTVDSCEFRNSSGDFLIGILVQDGQNRVTVSRCVFDMVGGSNSDAAISFTATATAVSGHRFVDNWIHGDFDLAGIDYVDDTAATTRILIKGNYIKNANTGLYAIDLDSTGSSSNVTGLIADNYVATTSGATAIYASGCDQIDNKYGLASVSAPVIQMGAPMRAFKAAVSLDADIELFEVDGGPVIITGLAFSAVDESEASAETELENIVDGVNSRNLYPTDQAFEVDDEIVEQGVDVVIATATGFVLSEASDSGDTLYQGLNWLLPNGAGVHVEGAGATATESDCVCVIDYISLGGVLETE